MYDNNPKNLTEVLEKLRKYKETHQQEYQFTTIGVFGSVARGSANKDSDIDIVIQQKTPDLFLLGSIKTDLEETFGTKVDIVRLHKNMNSFLRKRIEQEVIYA